MLLFEFYKVMTSDTRVAIVRDNYPCDTLFVGKMGDVPFCLMDEMISMVLPSSRFNKETREMESEILIALEVWDD